MAVLNNQLVAFVLLALLTALTASFVLTPVVKTIAYKVGAIDVPKDGRRMHTAPIPRLGGLAIFLGFLISVLMFVPMTPEMKSILLGAVVIVVLGIIDDIMALPALLKFVVQIAAALIPALNGVNIEVFSNPNLFSEQLYWRLGGLSLPFTVLWIVAVTNSVNLIDGLDGLAAGVSTISATAMLMIALVGGEADVSIVLGAVVGACLGFLPYNFHPARMFMGDTGATFLGYILAAMSIQGLYKYYAVISFVVPFLILGLPIFDTTFAFVRRLAHGQNPMHADRGHIHHRLIDMGLSQKQAVATLYVISAILGLSAVVLTTGGGQRAVLLFATLGIAAAIAASQVFPSREEREARERENACGAKTRREVNPAVEALAGETPSESGPAVEASAGNPAVDALAEEAPSESSPAVEASAGNPAVEALAEEAPSESGPAAEASAGNPAVEALAGEAPSEKKPGSAV